MKRALGIILGTSVALQPVSAGAELFKNFKADGRIEVQAVSAKNVSFLSTPSFEQIGDAQTRVMLDTRWDLLDDIHAVATFRKNNRIYGQAGESLNTVESNLFVDQAHIKIDKLLAGIDATVGRQFFGEPGDLVAYFGPSVKPLYGLPVNALDAARFDWSNGAVGVTGVAGKIAAIPQGIFPSGSDSGIAFGPAGPIAAIDLRGLIAAFKGSGDLSGSAHIYNRVVHLSDPFNNRNPNDYLWVVGGKAAWAVGGFWLKGDVEKNFGEDRLFTDPQPAFFGHTGIPLDNYNGWAFLIDAGYKADIAGFGGVAPWVEFGDGSGGSKPGDTFQAIAGDYRPGAIYGLFAPGSPATLGSGGGAFPPVSTNTLGNRVIFGVGVNATPSIWPKLAAGLSYWNYRFHTTLGSPNIPLTVSHLPRGNKYFGSEVDIAFNYSATDNLFAGITLGQFWPGAAIKNADLLNTVPTSNATLAEANLTVKF